jgi:hypothetical protein
VAPADPVAYVLPLNLHRRHLTTSQRAMIAQRARDCYDAEALKRKVAGGKDAGRGRPKQDVAKTAQPIGARGASRDIVGRAVGVSGTTVDQARKVIRDGVPELVRAVDDGKVPVYEAARLAAKPPEEQRAELNGPTAPVVPDEEEPADHTLSAEDREREQKQKGKAVEAAHEAINCLMKIRRDNPGRARAFQMVRDWMKGNS